MHLVSRSVAPLLAIFVACSSFAETPSVRSILSNHCFACHGPDENHREADLRFDIESEIDGEELIDRITSSDPDVMMPPPEMKKPLSEKQVAALTKWANDGAPIKQHWAFEPLADPEPPEIKTNVWSDLAIDRFVLERLRSEKRKPNVDATKRTLLRRLFLDLTGLPPTGKDVQRFLEDQAPDAYERLVDELLDRPAYGEHMARYWLDLVRFADTNGLHHDHYREMTPYRDWVIRSFNNNLPYDDFLRYQIAGDLYDEASNDQLIASGFNRLHLIIDVGTALPEESFMRNVVDRVSAVGTAFMGLTVQCAVCHDHKYDPITQKDFYQLYAFFNNFDGKPETGGRRGTDFKRGLQPPYLELPSKEQQDQLQKIDADIQQLQARIAEIRANHKKHVSEFGKEHPEAKAIAAELKTLEAKAKVQNENRDNLLVTIPATLIMKERSEARPAHIMVRGQYDQPGEKVERNTPAFLPALESSSDLPSRMDLANWLVSPEHPLTARVAVNRIWQHLFGVGLVKTSEDFGAQGESPSHPKLLDHLASRFVKSGWDVKALIRTIVMSRTYQQSSTAPRSDYENDPENRLLARGSRYRLDAEVVRDQVLSLCGLLNPKMHGRSVKPPQPKGIWEIVAMPSSYPRVYKADSGDDVFRRSVYTFWKRAIPPPQMTIFDAPTRESCIARRERTNTPLQALVLMNESQYFSAAIHRAKQLLNDSEDDDHQRLKLLYESITFKSPSEWTLAQMKKTIAVLRDYYRQNPAECLEMLGDGVENSTELSVWTMMVHSLLNLDETRTRE